MVRIILIIILGVFNSNIYASDDTSDIKLCVEFTHPKKWIPIQSNICTMSVTTCDSVKSVLFKAQYVQNIDSIPKILDVRHITRSPFKLVWNISDIPNQLTRGITCFAESEYLSGVKKIHKQEGIFFIHKPVERPVYKIKYSMDSLKYNTQSITLLKPLVFSKAYTKISWNERYLLFHIEVNNSLFYSTLPADILEKLGITIYLDPSYSKQPYISEEIACFMIPVNHKPSQIKTVPFYNSDGTFEYKITKDTCTFNSSVFIENFKGYTINFYIPVKVFGSTLPETIGCNIIATVINENSEVKELSWVQGAGDFITSPFIYGELITGKKPFLANPFLLWFISFVIGILLSIIGIYFRKLVQKYNPLVKFEDSEIEKQLIKNINTILEADIVNCNFSIKDISSKLEVSSQKVNAIIKKHYGRTFKNHLHYCRVEIVKERLRSSNASESAISKSCGFESVNEMEKQFQHFCGVSPYVYRNKNRIT